MTIYIIRRLLQGLAFIFITAFLIYTMYVMLTPDGPHSEYEGYIAMRAAQDPHTTQSDIDISISDLEQRYKFDRPWPVSFLAWLFDTNPKTMPKEGSAEAANTMDVQIGSFHLKGAGALTGDFGRSQRILRGVPVGEAISTRWVNTAVLIGAALTLTLLVAIPIGIVGAVRQHSWLDHIFTLVSFVGLSMPSFALGLLLIVLFAVLPKQLHDKNNWGWMPYLPPGDVIAAGKEDTLQNRLYHLILPTVALAMTQIVWISRYVRFSMLDVLRQDYVRTAWAKGLARRRVILKHAFRNALIPLITVIGLTLPAAASGAIIIEMVFNYTGMGQLFFRALGGCLTTSYIADFVCPARGYPPDYPLALFMTLLLVVIVAIANLAADILYAFVDPRVTFGSSKR
jgi:peptide/nickel transport system permease protein